MILSFYNNSQDPRIVKKSLSLIAENVPFQLTDRVSVTDPVLLVDYSIHYMNSNYVYIPEFGRYYYITDKHILNGNQLQLTLHVDVLKSFWNSFKNSPCTAARSTSNYDDYLEDEMVTIKPTYRTESRRLYGEFTPTSDGSNHYVLTIGGME